jgi:hypothetical protein
MRSGLWATLLFLASCAGSEEGDSAGTGASGRVPLDAPRLLRRISLDIRGTLPSTADLDAVEADPGRVQELAAGYIQSDAFETRFTSLLAERWHTVMDVYEVGALDYGLPTELSDQFAHSVGEEPLRLIAHVVKEDLPWSEIVTADYTMTNELLASLWPVEPLGEPMAAEGWEKARYTDGRPAAGVLATNGFYWRYVTNVSNKSRGRVAAISRLLLCTDILARPVVFQRSQTLDPEEAIRTEPACVTCHVTVDPLAASMFGFWWTIQYNPYEMQTYHPERERLGPDLLDTEPGYYGTTMGGLVDLGFYISQDPRFSKCAVESMAEQLWHRPVGFDDYAMVDEMWADFEAGGQHPQALLLDVLSSEPYAVGGFDADANDTTREREVPERLLSPNQQRLLLADLAGLEWTQDGFSQLENDKVGFRDLAGGVDGYTVTSPQSTPGFTWVLANKRAAQAAAYMLVARDLGVEGATVLTVPTGARPGDEAFSAQLDALHWRLYAVRADSPWRDEMGELWSAVEATHGPAEAWEAVVEAMLRDPLMVTY